MGLRILILIFVNTRNIELSKSVNPSPQHMHSWRSVTVNGRDVQKVLTNAWTVFMSLPYLSTPCTLIEQCTLTDHAGKKETVHLRVTAQTSGGEDACVHSL